MRQPIRPSPARARDPDSSAGKCPIKKPCRERPLGLPRGAIIKATRVQLYLPIADIPAMTQLARRVLREEFINADMGISGCNFAVAETGSITTCTNEGNGRLCTTMPRIHVAIMGIERIVPTVQDLGVTPFFGDIIAEGDFVRHDSAALAETILRLYDRYGRTIERMRAHE